MIRMSCWVACFVAFAELPCFCLPAQGQAVEETLDVAYGPDPLQRLDIYAPKGATGKLPTVVWIHGGGWEGGNKRADLNGIGTLAPTLVKNGYVAISLNYRLAPKHRHPAQVDDVQRAVRWLRANAAKHHIDPDRIGAVGISAGGHLTAVLAVRETRTKQGDELDKFSSKVQAAVVLNGPTDLRDAPELWSPVMTKATGNLTGDNPARAKEILADASPINFVARDSSPVLFIVGSADPWVPNAHATHMADALKKNNVDAEVIVLDGAGHGIFPTTTPKVTDAVLQWFAKKLKPSN